MIRPRPTALLAALAAFSFLLAPASAPAAPVPHAPPAAWTLPPTVAAALDQAHVPASALALWVQPVDAATPSWGWNPDFGVNPASVFKLATTSAALDRLGPAWSWKTPVYFTGPLRKGVLQGSVVIRGSGDPSLVLERVWLLLRQLRNAGVRDIHGDIVLDHGAFAPAAHSAADFDNAPSEPYNVLPDALLLNFKTVMLSFQPDPVAKVAHVVADPPLADFSVDASVPLLRGGCDDWRGALKLAPDDAAHWRFKGGYPASCGARNWPLAYPDPASYDARLIAAMWRDAGGRLSGKVRDGVTPADATPAFEFASPPLAEIVRDINKYSNNVMAEQVFLTLAAQAPEAAAAAPGATPEQARAALSLWLHERLGAAADGITIVNGSGLARETRISARTLAQLLQWNWRSAAMPELMSSLPLNGVDGTLRRGGITAAPGRAHMKTGSMRDVAAIAGYVLADSGRRYILVAVINDPNAGAARGALDAAIEWVERDPAQAAPAKAP
jgi:D-alanyl-D-alanine carboxypeptidase/D-alanyl-D-alanine-endopeptidase (penicillin-binding protein 4)